MGEGIHAELAKVPCKKEGRKFRLRWVLGQRMGVIEVECGGYGQACLSGGLEESLVLLLGLDESFLEEIGVWTC